MIRQLTSTVPLRPEPDRKPPAPSIAPGTMPPDPFPTIGPLPTDPPLHEPRRIEPSPEREPEPV